MTTSSHELLCEINWKKKKQKEKKVSRDQWSSSATEVHPFPIHAAEAVPLQQKQHPLPFLVAFPFPLLFFPLCTNWFECPYCAFIFIDNFLAPSVYSWQLTDSCCRYDRDSLKAAPFHRAAWPPKPTRDPINSETNCPAEPLQAAPKLPGSVFLAALWQRLPAWLAWGLNLTLLPPPACFHVHPIFLGLHFSALLLVPSCGHSTLQVSSSNTTLTVFPHTLQISSQPPLQLAPRCSPPHEPAAAPWHVEAFPRESGPETRAGSRISEGREHRRSKAPFAGDGGPASHPLEPSRGTAADGQRGKTGWALGLFPWPERNPELRGPDQGEVSSGGGAAGPRLLSGEWRPPGSAQLEGLSPGFSKHIKQAGAAGCHHQAKRDTNTALHPPPDTNSAENVVSQPSGPFH